MTNSWTTYGEKTEGYWELRWSILDYPDHWLTTSSGIMKKGKVFEKAEFFIKEEALLFKCMKGEFAIPNNPEALELLEIVIKEAKKMQKKLSEEERIEEIRTLKKFGYLDQNAYEGPLKVWT